MKLWTATVEVTVLIASDDEPSDYEIEDAAREEMDNSGCDTHYGATTVDALKDIPKEWRGSIPHGDADDKTCEQIVNEYLDAEAEEAGKRPMPNQTSLPLED